MNWFTLIGIALGLVFTTLALLPSQIRVSRTRVIQSTATPLFNYLSDFRNWPHWSPWLLHEPECKLTFSKNQGSEGSAYAWDGQIIRAGEITLSKLQKPNLLRLDLRFLKPFRSRAVTEMQVKAAQHPGATELCWSLSSRLPLLTRPMRSKMEKMIGLDFEIGMALLATRFAKLSTPRFEFCGDQELGVTQCAIQSWAGASKDMAAAIEHMHQTLKQQLQKADIEAAGQPLTLYRKMKKGGDWHAIEVAIPIAGGSTPAEIETTQLSGGRYLQVQLFGDHQYLPHAWHLAINHARMANLHMDWKRPCVELYEIDSSQTSDVNELVTSLFVPVK